MAWLQDVEDCDQLGGHLGHLDQVEDSLGDVDPGILLTHKVDVAHRKVLEWKIISFEKFSEVYIRGCSHICKHVSSPFAQLPERLKPRRRCAFCRCTWCRANSTWQYSSNSIQLNETQFKASPVVEEVVKESSAGLLPEPETTFDHPEFHISMVLNQSVSQSHISPIDLNLIWFPTRQPSRCHQVVVCSGDPLKTSRWTGKSNIDIDMDNRIFSDRNVKKMIKIK